MHELDSYDEKAIEIRKQCELICNWFLDNKCSIRQCAENVCIPKSTIHTYIHTYIKRYYDDEYMQIIRILQYNRKYRSRCRSSWIK